jgi:CRP-like cAMP-binding protein/ribosomal protein S18 acetylase RimI-like enzyme
VTLDRELAGLEVFSDCDTRALRPLAAAFDIREHGPGAVLVREGEVGDMFLIVLDGCVTIVRSGGGERELGCAGPGSILGEVAMLTGRPQSATVTVETHVRVAVGDRAGFDMLMHLPGVAQRLAKVVARHLAETAVTVPLTLRDGSTIGLRPLVPHDRAQLDETIDHQSPDWLRGRFFTGGRPSRRTIEYLTNINYIDHFAWVAVTAPSNRVIGVGRYVRLSSEPTAADISFGVAGEHQGRGIATLLLGALAVTAPTAGITSFTAEVLLDNAPMLAVFRKVGARWTRSEGGVGATKFTVATAAGLIDDPLAEMLRCAARDIVTGAGLALARFPAS